MINAGQNIAKIFARDIVDFIYPPICIVSEARLPEGNSNNFVSDEVLNKLEIADNYTLIKASQKLLCKKVYSKFIFEDDSDLQTIIHHLKYKKMNRLGILLGEILSEELKFISDISDYTIIPVPLHPVKEKERGYNQSVYIAKGISSKLGIPVQDKLVKRIRNTPSQTLLTGSQREKNVMDAFCINDKSFGDYDGRPVLILDDVITTGSTVNEVTKVVTNDLGVKEVIVASIAIAV